MFSISKIKTLPIIKKYEIIKRCQLKPLTKYHKLCLSFIIPHGSTDILVFDKIKVIQNYLFSFAIFNLFEVYLKYIFLFLFSVFHIRNDVTTNSQLFKILYSIGIHSSWVIFPEFSLTYLTWIHTIIHYSRVLPLLNKSQICSIIICTLLAFIVVNDTYFQHYIDESLWIPLIIGHILNNR
ncbi:hypothetical protein CL656_06180 [bacterium]|nr:hypothetical protein [bacterium]|tara:strand:+ start:3814 stop:4356 length:543 start_codon:yes stop_codon:yes gene_type:complete